MTLINRKWDIILPPHRAARPEWPTWEYARLKAMSEVIKPGDVVFDVGAEEGDLSGLYASWGAELVLFEPNPRVWPNIRHIWTANDFDDPISTFVGFAADDTTASFDTEPRRSDDHIWPECAYGEVIGDHGFRTIIDSPEQPRITLDHFSDSRRIVPDVLTVDVEGAELRVLKGAKELLATVHPQVFVSVHHVFMQNYGDEAVELMRFMRDLGYEATWLDLDHEEHFHFH